MSPNPSSRFPRIAIIGGGPAGLTLGLLLHKHHIPTTIVEYRPKTTEKDLAEPSGMLDLHEDSGLIAIRECGLWDDFIPLTGECAEVTKIANKHGHILHESKPKKAPSRPEISRHNLTKLLTRHLPPGTVKWEHKLLSATSRLTATYPETDLTFAKHGKHTFDLVIGADGAFSKTRSLLLTGNETPSYAGKQVITLTIKHLSTKHPPHLSRLVGPGTFMALGDRRAVVSQRGPMDSARIYLFLPSADEHFAEMAELSPAAAKAKLLTDDGLLGSWGAPIKELVRVACDEEEAGKNPAAKLDGRALYTLPDGNAWEHRAGATLIGDAAHLMLPNGEGVNMAMLDAVLLSRAIVTAYTTAAGSEKGLSLFHDTFDPLLRAFEVDEAARAKVVAEESRWLNETMYGEGGAEALAKAFLAFDA